MGDLQRYRPDHDGELRPAAAEARVSVATLSRRMRTLEGRIGQALFRHGADGYALTPEGAALARHTHAMEREASGLGRAHAVRVRITAGTWPTLDLAEHLPRYWRADRGWTPDCVQCDRVLDIGRRAVDIGITNTAPNRPWLAGRRTGHVDYGVFAANADVQGWIGPADSAMLTRSQRWMLERHEPDVVARANTPTVAAAMAEAGLGRVVLPIFAGESRSLQRLGDPIADLRTEEWLVAHHEGRHTPAIRRALADLTRYLRGRPKLR